MRTLTNSASGVFGMPILIAALVVLLAYLNAQLWLFDDRGLRQVWTLQAEVAAQQAENAALEERNGALRAEVASLKTGPAAIEERARAELGMIRRDETFFRILRPQDSGKE